MAQQTANRLNQYAQKVSALPKAYGLYEPNGTTLRNVHSTRASADAEAQHLLNINGVTHPVIEIPLMDLNTVNWWYGGASGSNTQPLTPNNGSGSSVPISMPSPNASSGSTRQNNDGRSSCYACGSTSLKQVSSGFSFMTICDDCGA